MGLKNFFLYRAYKHSKLAAAVIAIFITVYAILFYKKMDMVLFRYNNMFSQPSANKSNVVFYAAKFNGQLIPITNKPYWKKDFLESSLASFANYIKNSNKTFMQFYLHNKFGNIKWYPMLYNKLVADSSAMLQFPLWYFKFASDKKVFVNQSVMISIWQYHYDFTAPYPLIKDSILVIGQYYKIN